MIVSSLNAGLRAFAVVMLGLCLVSCTTRRPPNADMPDKASIQRGKTVVVQAGENVYVVAQKNGVSMRELIVLNDLESPYTLKAGQKIVLPYDGAFGDLAPPEAAPLAPVEKTNLAPIVPAGVSSQPLAPLASSPSVQVQPVPQARVIAAQPVATGAPDPLAPRQVAQAKTVTTSSAAAEAEVSQEVAAASDSSGPLKWPVQGPVLSAFGSKAAGLANDGVNIGAPKGSPVAAAASGTVAYVGNDMKGFGNLVLIKHQGDLVTAYAHLERVLVKKDSVVAQGDMIGTVGKTGNVLSPQLHFEVRQSGKPLDPAQMIKSGG
jgi:murein DD-endopeptidase MepM/ murein hydrolase activator NlpD